MKMRMLRLHRRRIGPAYEKHPSQRFGDWVRRNVITLAGSSVAVIVFWAGVYFGVDLVNFIATGGELDKMNSLYHEHILVIGFKLIGGFLLFLLIVSKQAK